MDKLINYVFGREGIGHITIAVFTLIAQLFIFFYIGVGLLFLIIINVVIVPVLIFAKIFGIRYQDWFDEEK